MVYAHAHEIFRARLLVESNQMVWIELVALPGFNNVFKSRFRRMSKVLQMPLVLPLTLDVHVARIPVSRLRRRLRPPVRPYTKLGVAIPLRDLILLQRFPRAPERAGLDHFFSLPSGKRFRSFKRGPSHSQDF